MNRSRLLLVVASVLAGTAAVLLVAGVAYNLVFAILSLPFVAGAYFLWADATGRLRAQWARSARRDGDREGATRGPRPGGSRRAREARTGEDRRRRRATARESTDGGMTPGEARRVLGVEEGASEEAIREAYRERVKEVHPDAAEGDEEAFKRVTDARDRLL